MDSRRYDRSGKYAATHDFETQPRECILDNVVSGIEAMTASIRLGTYNQCSSASWSLNYLETGLKLLGYTKASSLVKKNFVQAVSVFGEELKKQGI